ncbi:MAG: putative family peptidase [Paenibacillaceae bacterium]|jgi:Zn-dependent protease with chaperone function|nr:putative family peptidase [Paenibacillaceae bacterium]
MRNRQAQSLIVFSILTAAIIFSQMVLYALFLMFHWPMLANLFDMCNNWLMKLRLPLVAKGLDVLVLSTVITGFLFTISQILASFRVKARFSAVLDPEQSRQMVRRYALAEGNLMVIRCQKPMAFTMGFFRPVIIMSTGLTDLLEEEELEAVVRHEQFHLINRDPLRTLCIYALSSIMWYVPILRWCHHCFKTTREVLADRYAISATGSAVGLGSALVKLTKSSTPLSMSFAHASFADTPINIRIRQLLDPQEKPRIKLPWFSAIVSFQVLVLLTALFLPAYL